MPTTIDNKIKLALITYTLIGDFRPLDVIAERLRETFDVDMTEREIAAVYTHWRKIGIGIEKKRFHYSEGGYVRARSTYSLREGKSIKRLLDILYKDMWSRKSTC